MLSSGKPAAARHRRRVAEILCVVASTLALSLPATGAERGLTLEEAWQIAESANPYLRAAEANRAAAEGQYADTRGLLWNNPQIGGDQARRKIPVSGQAPERQREWSAGLSQTFEIAGQHGYRREAASLDLQALNSSLIDVRSQVRAEIEQRFVRVLALQQRILAEQEALVLLEEADSAVRKRVAAGEDSRLDGNLTSIEAERGRNQLAALRETLIEARGELAAALQLPANDLPEVVGELLPGAPGYTLEQLLESARQRPQLRALQLREDAAASRLKLERAAVYPDVTIGISSGREGPVEARENVTTLSVSLPLPLFRRNAGGIGRALTESTQAQIERQAANRDVPALVRTLWWRVESLQNRVQRLEGSVQAALDQNQQLSTKSFRAGEIGLLQLLLVNRQVLEGRRDLIDARTELRLASVALELAAGWKTAGRSAP